VARPPRIYVPGLSCHVFQRGHNRATIFHEREDYDYFLALVASATRDNGLDVHGFSLMTNHYHLVATPTSKSALPQAMKQIDGGYTGYYNRKHSRLGTRWNGRYKAKLISDPLYWWTCLAYVEWNPVEAGLVAAPGEYEWSSYGVHASGVYNDWLVPHPLYEGLGSTPAERQSAYRALCSQLQVSDSQDV